jgi:hypothetical protein
MNMTKSGYIQDKVRVKSRRVSKSISSNFGSRKDSLFFPSEHKLKLKGYFS